MIENEAAMLDILDFYSFLKNPRMDNQSEISSLNSFLNLVWKSFLFLLGFSIIYEFTISAPLKFFNLLPNSKEFEINLLNVFIFSLLSPIIEELIFRLPLRITKFNISFSLSLIIFFIFFKLNIYIAFVSTIILFSVAYTLFDKESNFGEKLATSFNGYFYLFFYLQAIVFGLMHLINYDLNFGLAVLFPFIVMKHLFTGCFFGYIRVKYKLGIYVCIVTHIVINSIFCLTMIA